MQGSKTAKDMQTSLRGIANRARIDRKHRFRSLYTLLNTANLKWSFQQLRKDAAPGVDRVTFQEYERDLEANLEGLVERLKQKRYRAKLVRRKNIPKGPGKIRPLGIPALEDKILQMAVARILESIHEQDFLEISWGYRPGKGPQEASRALADRLFGGKYNWVVEADIRGFFEHIDHDWMIRMLQQRIDDEALLRLIRKWLKAGILEEDGRVLHPAAGTPQGGVVSPVLANIYLHYVLDLWFNEVVKKQCRGAAEMMRFADDFVVAFQNQEEAENFLRELPGRLAKFGLEVAEEKSGIVRFGRNTGSNGAFDFLGFRFYWTKTRQGKPVVKRMTAPKKMRQSVERFTEWIKAERHQKIRPLMTKLSRKLKGYWNYYGVLGNFQSLAKFWRQVMRVLYKWLNRRSQKSSYNWAGFNKLLEAFALPGPCIVESRQRQMQWNWKL